MAEDRIHHLELIQKVVDRMSGESARMKQFCLASIAVIASTAAATHAWGLGLVGVMLTLVFWVLDAKYLAQERWFRALYDTVREGIGPADS